MKTTTLIACLAGTLGGVLLTLSPDATAASRLEWIEQLGTSESDRSYGVSADGLGNVYISGTTKGVLGEASAGGWDAYVSKFNDSGTLLWTEQLGTNSSDFSYNVAADGLGNVFITGSTSGSLKSRNRGGQDAFVSKYNANGMLLWTEQLGTSSKDVAFGVSPDGLGNVYISGFTEGRLSGLNQGLQDAFLAKYNENGSRLWVKQLGTPTTDDTSHGVSADGLGNVYISGTTHGDLSGPHAGDGDAFVSKYSENGILLWTEQLGTSTFDWSRGVSTDGMGNVYISGGTSGNLGGPRAGSSDAFVGKFDANGNSLWTKQLGTFFWDASYGVAADSQGNVYMSGYTRGTLGELYAGGGDVFVSKFDTDGNFLWTEQLGTSEYDDIWAVSADVLGEIYITGSTNGSLGGPNAGERDVYIAKFSDPIPEPSTLLLGAMASLGLGVSRRR